MLIYAFDYYHTPLQQVFSSVVVFMLSPFYAFNTTIAVSYAFTAVLYFTGLFTYNHIDILLYTYWQLVIASFKIPTVALIVPNTVPVWRV